MSNFSYWPVFFLCRDKKKEKEREELWKRLEGLELKQQNGIEPTLEVST